MNNCNPRWGTWFIDWLHSECNGDGFYIWHLEMLKDHQWYREYFDNSDDTYQAMNIYQDWLESDRFIRFIFTFYEGINLIIWRMKLTILCLETKALIIKVKLLEVMK